MERLKNAALLARLISALRQQRSWTGDTHVQKAVYFLQEALSVPLGFQFILYWHGPFSFGLRDQLTAMRADGLIKIELQPAPYGPSYMVTELAANLQGLYSRTLGEFEPKIEFVAKTLGARGVVHLEQLATGYYVTKKMTTGSPEEDRAKELSRLKPHVHLDAARIAIREVDSIIAQTSSFAN